jgi:hypothetical protein
MDSQILPGMKREEVSVGDWMITILITAIPLVGLIMLFVWAFGGGAQASKKNWAIATLIWYAIAIVLLIIFFIIFGTILAGLFSTRMHTYS